MRRGGREKQGGRDEEEEEEETGGEKKSRSWDAGRGAWARCAERGARDEERGSWDEEGEVEGEEGRGGGGGRVEGEAEEAVRREEDDEDEREGREEEEEEEAEEEERRARVRDNAAKGLRSEVRANQRGVAHKKKPQPSVEQPKHQALHNTRGIFAAGVGARTRPKRPDGSHSTNSASGSPSPSPTFLVGFSSSALLSTAFAATAAPASPPSPPGMAGNLSSSLSLVVFRNVFAGSRRLSQSAPSRETHRPTRGSDDPRRTPS